MTPTTQTNTQSALPKGSSLQDLLRAAAGPEAVKAFEEKQVKAAIAQGKSTGAIENPFQTQETLDRYIGGYKSVEFMKQIVLKLASVQHPVLVEGPTGTGKEMIARALHGARQGPFIAINCGGLPNELIESELFGYEKGAFTGALSGGKVGPLEKANDGTVLLDEIGDLPLLAQVKLLRVLQESTIRRVGGISEIPIKCRFVCATHRDLKQMIKEKLFREDLYYRLSTFIVSLKPLTERPMDAARIAKTLCKEDKWHYIHLEKWKEQASHGFFSGNARQVEQIITRCEVLGWDSLPEELKG